MAAMYIIYWIKCTNQKIVIPAMKKNLKENCKYYRTCLLWVWISTLFLEKNNTCPKTTVLFIFNNRYDRNSINL